MRSSSATFQPVKKCRRDAGIVAQAVDQRGDLVDAGPAPESRRPRARTSASRPIACHRPGRGRPSGRRRRRRRAGAPRTRRATAPRRSRRCSGRAASRSRCGRPARPAGGCWSPAEEPQHFAHRGLPEHALGGQQRHRVARQVEAHRLPEQRSGADAGAVGAEVARRPHAADEVEILVFVVRHAARRAMTAYRVGNGPPDDLGAQRGSRLSPRHPAPPQGTAWPDRHGG